MRTDRDFSSLDADDVRNRLPVWGVDIGTLHGSQGFATLVSRKKVGDPLPLLERCMCFSDDGARSTNYSWGSQRTASTEALFESDQRAALAAMYVSSYTPPYADSIDYAPSFLRVSLYIWFPGGLEPHSKPPGRKRLGVLWDSFPRTTP